MNEGIIEKSLNLIKKVDSLVLSTIDYEGYPNTKAMLKLENKNFDYFYLSTNTSSTKVKHIIRNPKATVYFYDEKNFIGLELIGKIVIINDEIIKSKLWKEEFKIFYKEGKDDPDYCILKFIPEKGNYYENLKNYDFKLR